MQMAIAGAVSSRTKAAVFVVHAGYSWVMTVVHPLNTTSYVMVAVPSLAFVIAYVSLGGLSHRRDDVDAHYRPSRRAPRADRPRRGCC